MATRTRTRAKRELHDRKRLAEYWKERQVRAEQELGARVSSILRGGKRR